MQSNNPAFAGDMWSDLAYAERRSQVMTVEGTSMKALILLVVLTATASMSWTQVGNGRLSMGLLLGGLIGGLVFFFATMFKKEWSPVTAPLYAACEGLLLGAISGVVNQQYQGIVVQAVGLTFATTFIMLFLYVTRMIRVTQQLAAGIIAATGALCLFYLVALVLSLFGVHGLSATIYGSGPIGIGISLVAVGLAAFNLLLDFDVIEQGARAEAPKYMEWYGAFGLMVTLIWLYLEILRLLRKFSDRR